MLTKIINNYTYKPEDCFANQIAKDADQLILYYGNQNNFPDQMTSFYQYLSNMEISRAKRFIRKSDKRTYVISHAFLNRKISELSEKDFNQLKINYFKNKKPYVEESSLDFNLSHSSDYFAFAISDNRNNLIGVDIEVVKEKFDFKQIIYRYFHENEIKYILDNKLNNWLQRKRFYEVWTRKEAFFKMFGKGISEELSEIDLSPGEREIMLQDKNHFYNIKIPKIYIYTSNLSENQILSVSTNHPAFIITEHCTEF